MKSLIVYSSQSGNTKKLAEALFEALTGEKEIYPIDEAPEPDGYDFIALGFWLMAGKPDPKSAKYLEKIGTAKLFLFATHGAGKGSDHAKNAMAQAKNLAPGATIVGLYECQGEVNPKILEKVKAKPEPLPWIGDADDAVGHPDESDINELKNIVSALSL